MLVPNPASLVAANVIVAVPAWLGAGVTNKAHSLENALETWADDGGVTAERVGLDVGAAGAAFWPHAANGRISTANNTQ